MATHPRVSIVTVCFLWLISAVLLVACVPLFMVLNAGGFEWYWPFSTYPAAQYNVTFSAIANFFDALTWLAFSTLGTLIVMHHPRHRVGWIFAMIGLLGAVELFTAHFSWQLAFAPVPGGVALAWVNNWVWVLNYGLRGAFLPLYFPNGQLAHGRWGIVAWLTGASMAAILLIAAFHVGPLYNSVERLQIPNPLAMEGFTGTVAHSLEGGSFILLNLCLLVATLALFHRLRHTSADERQPLKWLAYFIVIMALLLVSQAVINVFLGIESPLFEIAYALLWAIAATGLPIASGFAILKYRLWDIDLIINRTLVYGALTAIIAGSIGALSSLFQALFVAITGSKSDLATVLAALIVGIAISPLQTVLQSLVDKAFKDSGDPAKKLARFQEQVQQRLDPLHRELALRRLLSESVTAFAAQGGAIYWGNGSEPRLAHSLGEWTGEATVKALLQTDQQVCGYLALGPRRDRRPYSAKDDQVLQKTAHVVALAIEQDRQLV